MRARKLLEDTTLCAEALSVAFEAFDNAWADIARYFPDDADDGRARLAHAVLVVVRDDSRDVLRLKNDALQLMAVALARRQTA